MAIVKTHAKGQIITPKDIRVKLGIKPWKVLSFTHVDDHVEIRPIPDDPIEFLTSIFEKHRGSMADELLKERKNYNEIDELNPLWFPRHSEVGPETNQI